MRTPHLLDRLRQSPHEWHRRGMRAPAEIDTLIADRIGQSYTAATPHVADPSYADFFVVA